MNTLTANIYTPHGHEETQYTHKVELVMPRDIERLILSQYHNSKSDVYPGYFMVANNRLNGWLSHKLGIYTDCPIFLVNNTFLFFFDWNTQSWRVK